MANIVTMPQLGISEESAVLTRWYVSLGDKVRVGDNLFAIETGKSSFDVQSEHEGEVLALFAEENDELLIKAPLCAVGKPGEAFEAPASVLQAPEAAIMPEPGPAAIVAAIKADMVSAKTENGRISASPRARALASRTGAEIGSAIPTGPENRIIERDVIALLDRGPASAPAAAVTQAETSSAPSAQYEDKPVSRIRKTIAVNMHKSLSEMAQLTLNSSFDATEVLALRKRFKESGAPAFAKVSINDIVLYAVARTLPEFPYANAHYLGDTMRYFNGVNLGMAVDTERGLMVPVISGADKLSLVKLSFDAKKLASACQDGSISPDSMKNGTFTVTNLGALGIESFTPVINPPQTAILGINTIITKVRESNDGLIAYPSMPLSLTFDHRAMDGAPAARLLAAICRSLEQITLTLAKG